MSTSDELEALLGGRPGWRLLDDDDDAQDTWGFGEHGEARIVVNPEGSGFHTYVAEVEEDLDHQTIADLTAWIEVNEPAYRGLSELAKQHAEAAASPDLDQWEQEIGES